MLFPLPMLLNNNYIYIFFNFYKEDFGGSCRAVINQTAFIGDLIKTDEAIIFEYDRNLEERMNMIDGKIKIQK